MQDDVAPEHHAFAARGNFAVDFVQEIEIDPAFAQSLAKLFALAAPQIPGLVAADVEKPARKIGQQCIVKTAQKWQRAGMIWRERCWPADKFSTRVFIRRGNLGQFFQTWMLQQIAHMAERILVRHKINAEITAARVERADFGGGQRAPALPGGYVFAIGERMLRVDRKSVV